MSLPIVLYAVLRTGAVVALLGIALAGHRPRFAEAAGQLAADAAAAVLLLAFGSYVLRASLGIWGIAIAVYFIAWEARAAARRWQAIAAGPDLPSWAELFFGPWQWAWDMLVIAPPLAAGVLVALNQVLPFRMPFASQPPPIVCAPDTLGPRDTLRMRLDVPHGGQLMALTPAGRPLIVVPFAPATVARSQRFEFQGEVILPAERVRGQAEGGGPSERVFSDSGTYTLMVSELAEVGASLVCRVRYRGG